MGSEDFRIKIWDLLREIADNLQTSFHLPEIDNHFTLFQLRILLEIREHGLTVGALGKKFNIAHGNASSLCKKLEKEGYIQRIRDESDERLVNLTITEKGIATLDHMMGIFRSQYASFWQSADQGQIQEMIIGLERLNDMLIMMREYHESQLSDADYEEG